MLVEVPPPVEDPFAFETHTIGDLPGIGDHPEAEDHPGEWPTLHRPDSRPLKDVDDILREPESDSGYSNSFYIRRCASVE